MMDYCSFVVFWMVFAYLTPNIRSQESPQSECQVWADPHLLMFAIDPTQEGFRMSYWCRTPGRMTVLKNKFIEFYVDVTEEPFWNENFEIKFLSNRQVICIITHDQSNCSNIFLNVLRIGHALDIQYNEADQLSVTITSHSIDNRTVFNIIVTQSYDLIRESTGLCAIKPANCRLESSVNPFGRRRKRAVDRAVAEKVCDEYMKEAYKTAKDLLGNPGNNMAEHARAACVTDLSLTGNGDWGESAIGYVMMNALKQLKLNLVQRREKLKVAIPAISRAAAIAKERTYRLLPSKPDGKTCAHHPCQNNRPCFNNGNSYYCHCGEQYTGTNCEITQA